MLWVGTRSCASSHGHSQGGQGTRRLPTGTGTGDLDRDLSNLAPRGKYVDASSITYVSGPLLCLIWLAKSKAREVPGDAYLKVCFALLFIASENK